MITNLYYATSDTIERGQVLWAKETFRSPEFVVFHPLDLEAMKRGVTGRRLVPLRDYGRPVAKKPACEQIYTPADVATIVEVLRIEEHTKRRVAIADAALKERRFDFEQELSRMAKDILSRMTSEIFR